MLGSISDETPAKFDAGTPEPQCSDAESPAVQLPTLTKLFLLALRLA